MKPCLDGRFEITRSVQGEALAGRGGAPPPAADLDRAPHLSVRGEVPVQGRLGHAAEPHEFGDVRPLVGGGAERAFRRGGLVTVRGIARLVWVALGVAGSADEVPRHRLGGGRAEADLAQEYEVAPRVVWHALATLAANRYVDRAGKFASYRVTWQPVK